MAEHTAAHTITADLYIHAMYRSAVIVARATA